MGAAAMSEPDGSAAASVECSAQILRVACYDLVPLREPIAKAWDLLGVSPHGLVVVTVVRGDWPEMSGLQRLALPPRWPADTTRVIHRYLEGQALPEVRVLS